MASALGGGERKRGKSMFGVLLNTLNKAKAEDKERNASEAVCNPSSRILRLITHILKYIHTYINLFFSFYIPNDGHDRGRSSCNLKLHDDDDEGFFFSID